MEMLSKRDGSGEKRDEARDEADGAEAQQIRATLPPPGSPLTGEGGVLPRFRPPQVRPGTIALILIEIALFVGLLALIWQVRDILRWIVIAVFLAVALGPAVDFLQKRGVKRALAIGIVYLALFAVIGVLGAVVFPPFVNQIESLVNRAVQLSRQPEGLDRTINDITGRFGIRVSVQEVQQQLQGALTGLSDAVGPLFSVTRSIITSITAIISILLMTFFLLLDGERFAGATLNLFAANQRPRLRRLLGQMSQAVYGYVRGAFSIATICGVLTFIALTILQMPYAVALALLVAVFDLIPLVGATVGAAIVVIVALFVNPVTAGILIVYFFIYQQVENNVFQPIIYGRNVKVHPFAILVAVLVGAQLLGILGTLLAIPVAEILRILFVEFFASRARDRGGMIHGVESETPVEQVTAEAASSEGTTA